MSSVVSAGSLFHDFFFSGGQSDGRSAIFPKLASEQSIPGVTKKDFARCWGGRVFSREVFCDFWSKVGDVQRSVSPDFPITTNVGISASGKAILRNAPFPKVKIAVKIGRLGNDVCYVDLFGKEAILQKDNHTTANWTRIHDNGATDLDVVVVADLQNRELRVFAISATSLPDEIAAPRVLNFGLRVSAPFEDRLPLWAEPGGELLQERASAVPKAVNWNVACKHHGNPFLSIRLKKHGPQPPVVVDDDDAKLFPEEVVEPPANETFTCPVCSDVHSKDDIFIASQCGHTLCRDCAQLYVKSQYQQLYIPIKCWMRADDCKAELAEYDVELVLDDAGLRSYHRIAVMKSITDGKLRVIECVGEDCNYMTVMNAGDELPRTVTCEDCKVVFCPACRVPYHSEMDCAQFKRSQDHKCPRAGCDGVVKGADLNCTCPSCSMTWCWECGINPYHEGKTCEDMFKEFFKSCPECHLRTQKSEGCNHMKCTMCETHWCYLCEAALDPEHPLSHYGERQGTCYKKCFTLEDVLRG